MDLLAWVRGLVPPLLVIQAGRTRKTCSSRPLPCQAFASICALTGGLCGARFTN